MKKYMMWIGCLLVLCGCSLPKKDSKKTQPHRPRVVDCFLFNDELDLLEMRLHELYDEVDYFVLVEGTHTFQNTPKPLHFLDNKERYAQFLDKIIHVVSDNQEPHNKVELSHMYHEQQILSFFNEETPVEGVFIDFSTEWFQRSHIQEGLDQCHLEDRDIVMITDVDEIMRRESIKKIRHLITKKKNDVIFGEFELMSHFLNRKLPFKYLLSRDKGVWLMPVATSWKAFKRMKGPQSFRNLAYEPFLEAIVIDEAQSDGEVWSMANIKDIGWHFTYLSGNYTDLNKKIDALSHIHKEKPSFDAVQEGVSQLEWCPVSGNIKDRRFPIYMQMKKADLEQQGFIDTEQSRFSYSKNKDSSTGS